MSPLFSPDRDPAARTVRGIGRRRDRQEVESDQGARDQGQGDHGRHVLGDERHPRRHRRGSPGRDAEVRRLAQGDERQGRRLDVGRAAKNVEGNDRRAVRGRLPAPSTWALSGHSSRSRNVNHAGVAEGGHRPPSAFQRLKPRAERGWNVAIALPVSRPGYFN